VTNNSDIVINPFSFKVVKIKVPESLKNNLIIFEKSQKINCIEGIVRNEESIDLIILNNAPNKKIIRKHSLLGKFTNCKLVKSINNEQELVNFIKDEMDTEPVNNVSSVSENVKPWKPSKVIKFENTNLNKEQIQKVKDLIDKYWICFSRNDEDIGTVEDKYGLHDVVLNDDKPIKQKPYVIPQAKETVVKDCVEKMLKMNIIEPSNSNWASPIVLVKKPDGSERFCVDYRKLNNVTLKDSFPMPNIENRLNKLHGSKFFKSFDCTSGYWQIKLSDKAKQITSFICSLGLFSFKVMPFGLCNAGATFQRIMELILNKLTNSIAYIDDILTFSKTFDEHFEHLESLLKRLKEANMKVKTVKCKIARKTTIFLGYKISEKGIEIDESRVKVIKEYPKPKKF